MRLSRTRDARGKSVTLLDPYAMPLLRRHGVIPRDPSGEIAEEIGPGVTKRRRLAFWVGVVLVLGPEFTFTGGEADYIQLTAPADLWVNSNGCDDAGANLIAGAWRVPDFVRTAAIILLSGETLRPARRPCFQLQLLGQDCLEPHEVGQVDVLVTIEVENLAAGAERLVRTG